MSWCGALGLGGARRFAVVCEEIDVSLSRPPPEGGVFRSRQVNDGVVESAEPGGDAL